MDSQGMQFAMEQMSRMSPEQMQQMMASMGNITPEMMQQAQAQMRHMQPGDWERAKQQMSGMSPEEMARQAQAAGAQMSAQQQYLVNASNTLKAEGNKLHSAGQYRQAADKYKKAKDNLEGIASAEAKELCKACTLNLGSCYLNLKQYEKCITECDAVVSSEANNLKALYRRGQAYAGLSQLDQAEQDLKQAVQLACNDPKQLPLIKAKLEEVQQQLKQQASAAAAARQAQAPKEAAEGKPAAEKAEDPAAEPSSSKAAEPEAKPSYLKEDLRPPSHPAKQAEAAEARPSYLREDLRPASHPAKQAEARSTSTAASSSTAATATATAAAAQPSSSFPAAGFPAGLPSGMNPDMLKQAADMMKNNPGLAAQMQEQMRNMRPEQLAAMGKQMGVEMTPEMASAAINASATTDFSQMAAMAGAAGSAADMDPSSVAQAAKMMQENPSMLKTAASMMSSMSPEQLESMMGNLPGGMKMTPEMAKMAAEKMATMDPEEVQRMAAMAAQMQGAGSTPAAAAAAGSAAAGAALPLSEMVALGRMSAEQLTSAMAQAAPGGGPPGMAFTPEMASMAADMMKNMKPEDMARMAEMASKMGMGGPGMGAAGAGAAGGQPSMSDMAGMMDKMDPAMIDNMFNMLQGMDEQSLTNMMLSSGMAKSPEQAKAMAAQMKGMSPAAMEMMRKAARVVQGGAQAVKKTKEFVLQRGLLLALVILLVAILLRYFGVM